MTTPEGKVKVKVKRRLKELARVYQFWPVQMGLGAATLDVLLCAGGWFIAIETKKDANTPLTPRQEETKRQIDAAGGRVFVVYDDVTLMHAMEVIQWCCLTVAAR